jgi:transcriptional regulator with GAF, ATPase, and Fis domain
MADTDQIPAMLRICTLLQSARELYSARGTPTEHVFRVHLLALISDLVPSDQGAIFLIESGESTPAIVYEAVALKHPLFASGEMAVLLFVRDEIAGAIYLARAEPFSESDFGIITAISQIASIAIENSFHLERLRSEVTQLKEELGIEDELRGAAVSRGLRKAMRPFSLQERAAPARNWWRARCTTLVCALPSLSSPSIARR